MRRRTARGRVSKRRRGRAIASGLALLAGGLCLALVVVAASAKPGAQVKNYGSGGTARLSPDSRILDAAVQKDGKLVVVGVSGEEANKARMVVGRFTAAGKPDPKFKRGKVYTGPVGTVAHAVAIQGDGKIVVAGETTDSTGAAAKGMLVLRLKSNGSPDRKFSGNGIANALGDQSGKGLGVTIQRDGKIIVSGSAPIADGYPRAAFARFKPGGGLDRTFGKGGVAVLDTSPRFAVANDLFVQGNGRIVFGGSHRNNLQSTEVLVGRLKAGGSLDKSFSGDGFFIQQLAENAAFSAAYGVAPAPGGKIYIGGTATSANVGAAALAARLSGGGALQWSKLLTASTNKDQFGRDPLPGARGMAVVGGDVILAGHYDDLGIRKPAVWAVRASGAPDNRFGQSGRTLLSIPFEAQFDGVAAQGKASIFPVGLVTPEFLGKSSGLAVKVDGF